MFGLPQTNNLLPTSFFSFFFECEVVTSDIRDRIRAVISSLVHGINTHDREQYQESYLREAIQADQVRMMGIANQVIIYGNTTSTVNSEIKSMKEEFFHGVWGWKEELSSIIYIINKNCSFSTRGSSCFDQPYSFSFFFSVLFFWVWGCYYDCLRSAKGGPQWVKKCEIFMIKLLTFLILHDNKIYKDKICDNMHEIFQKYK